MAHVMAFFSKVNGKYENQSPYQGIVKHDWVPTGRIDFATHLNGNAEDADQPNDFKLLVEERRIVESIAGNENLEIQWRPASLKEAKAVVTHYHKYLSEHSLIKSVFEETLSLPAPKKAKSFGLAFGSVFLLADVRFGSLADIAACLSDVRFTPESGHLRRKNKYPLSARSGHSAMSSSPPRKSPCLAHCWREGQLRAKIYIDRSI